MVSWGRRLCGPPSALSTDHSLSLLRGSMSNLTLQLTPTGAEHNRYRKKRTAAVVSISFVNTRRLLSRVRQYQVDSICACTAAPKCTASTGAHAGPLDEHLARLKLSPELEGVKPGELWPAFDCPFDGSTDLQDGEELSTLAEYPIPLPHCLSKSSIP